MLRECMNGECAHKQQVRRTITLTLTHTITAYSVSGNARVRIFICATKQKPCRKRVSQLLPNAAEPDIAHLHTFSETWISRNTEPARHETRAKTDNCCNALTAWRHVSSVVTVDWDVKLHSPTRSLCDFSSDRQTEFSLLVC